MSRGIFSSMRRSAQPSLHPHREPTDQGRSQTRLQGRLRSSTADHKQPPPSTAERIAPTTDAEARSGDPKVHEQCYMPTKTCSLGQSACRCRTPRTGGSRNPERPAKTTEIDPPAFIKLDALRLQESALPQGGAAKGRQAYLTPSVDHALPGHRAALRQSVQRIADLTGPPRQTCDHGDLSVSRHGAPRDPHDSRVDREIRGRQRGSSALLSATSALVRSSAAHRRSRHTTRALRLSSTTLAALPPQR